MRIHSPQITGSAENTNIVTTTRITSLTALSASFAATASSADNLTVRGTLTAQTINVQTITSSIEFVTGSTRNGSLSSNTHQFTGSVLMTGSLVVNNNLLVTGSVTAAGAIARSTYINPTLVASANSDVLVGLDIAPNYEGPIGATNSISNGGSGYPTGSYTSVPLTGGAGSGAVATILASGSITSVTITSAGNGYFLGDVLSASNTNLGGAGSNFTYTVRTLNYTGIKTSGLRVDGIHIGRGGGYIDGNTVVGNGAGQANTTGDVNVFIGISAGNSNTTGTNNTSVGGLSGYNNTTGGNNIFIGRNAARYIANGSTSATIINNSIFIGLGTKPLANSQNNQIVIGYDSTGLGSNTTVLGNSSTTTTAIYGNLSLGSTVDAGYKLDVTGTARFTGTAPTPLLIERTGGINSNIQYTAGAFSMYAGNRGSSFSIGPTQDLATTSQLTVFGATGNVVIQNGGAPTDAGYRLDVAGTTRFQGTTASDTAPLGSELAAVTGTGTNWALAGTNLNVGGYIHTVGSVVPLTTTLAAVSGTYYQITYTITGRTAGSITIAYGGTSTAGITATGNTGPLASSTAVLTITPTTDFDGTVVLSIKTIGTSSASSTFANSSGTSSIEVRASDITSNTIIGKNSGRRNTTGTQNTFVGQSAGSNNTIGINNSFFGDNAGTFNSIASSNSFFGQAAGYSNTTGGNNSFFGSNAGTFNSIASNNSFFGKAAGYSNTIGSSNTFSGGSAGIFNTTGGNNSFFGSNAGYNNTTGGNNTFIGTSAGLSNATGGSNTFVGLSAGSSNTTGGSNTFIGVNSGRFISGGSTENAITNNSIYLGYNTKALADNQTNQIVIGYAVTGLGSNTTVLGNSSTLTTAIYGNLSLGSTVDAGYRLDVAGTARVSGVLTLTSTISNGTYAYTLPSATGTLALTSALSGYLPLTGGTLTGALIGTSATFSGDLTVNSALPATLNVTSTANTATYGGVIINRQVNTVGNGNGLGFRMYNSVNASAEYAYIGTIIETNTSTSENGAIIFAPTYLGVRTERMRITSAGNVGIGTTAPSSLLQVVSSTAYGTIAVGNTGTTGGGIFVSQQNGSNKAIFGVSGGIEGNTTSDAAIFAETSGNIRFYTNGSGSEKMRITNGGNILLGTTTDNGERLYVSGTIRATGSITANSDLTLKKNLLRIENALEKVEQINGYTYELKADDSKRHAGVIAQEIQTVLPEIVNKGNDGILGVEYGNISALLIEAIKELSAEITILKNK